MFIIKEYVPANEIWAKATAHNDGGRIDGYVRGYNIEVKLVSGKTDWLSTEWIYGNPEIEFDDDFHRFYFEGHQWTPTGRICFRGYAVERYDYEDHETYIEQVKEDLIDGN